MNITYSYCPQSASIHSGNILSTNRLIALEFAMIWAVVMASTTIHACSESRFWNLKSSRWVCTIWSACECKQFIFYQFCHCNGFSFLLPFRSSISQSLPLFSSTFQPAICFWVAFPITVLTCYAQSRFFRSFPSTNFPFLGFFLWAAVQTLHFWYVHH